MSREPLCAVVDQGSTSTKCALVDGTGEILREASAATATRRRAGRVELDAEAIADSVESLLQQVMGDDEVAAIGLTCQRSTCLLWDRRSGRAVTPALSWQDTSQTEAAEALAAHSGDVAERTGLPLSPHYAATKLAALLDEMPEGRRRAAGGELLAGTLDAFLMHRLTGEPATEPGHAGRTLLYNLDQGDWDPDLCALFGIPGAAMPALHDSVGLWGEYRGTPVCAGAGDQQAALVGHGGWRQDVAAVHFGTGAFVLAAVGGSVRRHEGLLSAVIASTPAGRRFQLEGSVNSAGSAVDWACQLSGQPITAWADRELVPEDLPWVVPAFAGLGAPWWEPRARGTITGLEISTQGADLVGGVLLGLAMRVVDNIEAMADAGTRPRVVRVSGKLTRLSGLVGLIADAAKIPVEVAVQEETGLLGIHRLAIAGLVGDEASLEDAPPVRSRREPRWTPARASSVRSRWRSLIESAMGN